MRARTQDAEGKGEEMKFADIRTEDAIVALRAERSAWVRVAEEEGRPLTEPERTTIAVLAALERAVGRMEGIVDGRSDEELRP